MKNIDDKRCYSQGPIEASKLGSTNKTPHHRAAFGKPAPSKWDDAQKWLVGLSRVGEKESQAKARDSNADDRRLIAPVPQREEDYSSGEEEMYRRDALLSNPCGVISKNVDYEDEMVLKVNRTVQTSGSPGARPISVRDMGTEMTPVQSQEPSRTGTPIQVRTPIVKSPISSGISTPIRYYPSNEMTDNPPQTPHLSVPSSSSPSGPAFDKPKESQAPDPSSLEARATAWDEAERARHTARYKREEVKIQAWENHETRRAEKAMKKVELKAERLMKRAQERLTNRIAATKRIAEEKRANAEAKFNDDANKTSEKADYIRRTGHLPSSLSIKLPSFCW